MFEKQSIAQHDGKFYGEYRAKVIDNKDPKMLGRIKVECPSVYGEGIESPWCFGKFPTAGKNHGFFMIPSIGDYVWITFEKGSSDYPVWNGSPYTTEISQRIKKLSNGKERKQPNIVAIISPAGHQIVLDEDPVNSTVTIQHKSGSKIVMNANGSISLIPSNGSVSIAGSLSISGNLTAKGIVNLG